MRPLEALLSIANLLALFSLAVPLPHAARWIRHSATVAFVMAAAQVLVEGPRWQMIPAYVLATLLFLVWMLRRFKPTSEPVRRKPTHRLGSAAAIGLGSLGLLISIALPTIIPVFRFPHPTGPYHIGTLSYHWVDASRSDVFAADPQARRELMAQIWYPAKANQSAARATYMPDAEAVTTAIARIHDKPAFLFRHFKYVTTHAIGSAPVAGDVPSFPVLIFLEGLTGFRQMNTFQVEALASHGYIVVALDQPGVAAAVMFPDGRQVAGLPLVQLRPVIDRSYMPESPGKGAPLLHGRVLKGGSIIPQLAQDASFTLDQLAALNQADPNGILTGRLDLQRVGTFGVSLGGIVVGEACRLEPRLRACLVMDAPMPTAVVKAGLQQPSMWITRDAATMRLERQRAGGWPNAEIEAHQTTMRAVYEGLPGAGYFVRMTGTFHLNFTDIANWTPLASQLNLSGPINGQRAHDIVNAYSLSFFDRHLLGRPATLLDGPAIQFPEVRFESRRRRTDTLGAEPTSSAHKPP